MKHDRIARKLLMAMGAKDITFESRGQHRTVSFKLSGRQASMRVPNSTQDAHGEEALKREIRQRCRAMVAA